VIRGGISVSPSGAFAPPCCARQHIFSLSTWRRTDAHRA
jgi:hypothetical protein